MSTKTLPADALATPRRWFVVTDYRGRAIYVAGSLLGAHARERAAELARDGSPTSDPGPVAFHTVEAVWPHVGETLDMGGAVEWIAPAPAR